MCVPFIKRCGVPPVRVKRNARAECTPHVVVVLSAPIDQHPYEPIPGAGGDTVGAASARQQEREIASQVLRAVEHCFRRLKAGLKVRAMASLSQYCVRTAPSRLSLCLQFSKPPSSYVLVSPMSSSRCFCDVNGFAAGRQPCGASRTKCPDANSGRHTPCKRAAVGSSRARDPQGCRHLHVNETSKSGCLD